MLAAGLVPAAGRTQPTLAEGGLTAAASVAGEPWLEGPTAGPDGTIYVSDVKGDQILALSPAGAMAVFRRPANYPKGLLHDGRGGLVVCEIGGLAPPTPPRLTRTELISGQVRVLADNIDGRGLLGPNDVTIDGRGRLYFTDLGRAPFIPPLPAGARPAFAEAASSPGVYRLDPDGGLARLLGAPEVVVPNGIGLSPDDRTLYLIDRRELVAFALSPAGGLSGRRVVHDFSPGRGGDGMAVDAAGNLWVAAGANAPVEGRASPLPAGVHVFAPDGRPLGVLPVPEDPVTNVAFGGEDLRTLYVTAGRTLYRGRARAPGTRR